MIGDVILLRNAGWTAPFNILLQRLLTGRLLKGDGYTHVAFGSGPWQVMHSMPAPWHVEFAAVHELLAPEVTRWRVWRNTAFARRLKAEKLDQFSLHSELSQGIGSAYNPFYALRFVLRDSPSHFICSHLVGEFAKKWDFAFDRAPHVLLPLDIAAEVERLGGDWTEVTKEYRRQLADDPHYRRLHFNDNSRDAAAHFAAYLHSKHSINEFARSLEAMTHGRRPQSRVKEEREPGLRVISSLNRPPEKSLNGKLVAELPEPYHGSICDWDRKIDSSLQFKTDDEYESMMGIPSRCRGREGGAPSWRGQHARHDAVLVLGRENVAKAAALAFDAVVGLWTDCVPASVLAWGANPAWAKDPARMHAEVREKVGAKAGAGIRIRSSDGARQHIRPNDQEAFLASIENAYIDPAANSHKRVLLGLDDAGLSGTALMVPAELIRASSKGRQPAAVHIELVDVPLVDVERLSWRAIVDLRSNLAAMRGLRALRHLLAPSWRQEAEDSAETALSEALVAYANAIRAKHLAATPGTFGVVTAVEEEATHPAWRLVQAAGMLPLRPSKLPAGGLSGRLGRATLRITPASATWAELEQGHGEVFTIG